MIDKRNTEKVNPENRRTSRIVSAAMTALLIVLTIPTALIYFGRKYLMDYWADLSMDEIIYHLKSDLNGTDPHMITLALTRYLLPAALIVCAVFVCLWLLRNKKKARDLYVTGIVILDILILLLTKSRLDSEIGLSTYLISQFWNGNGDFIGENYVDPHEVVLKFPEKKRNLIYIFLESAEITFADEENGGAFEKNIIPELTELAEKNENFSGDEGILNGAVSLYGTTWTSGAMFGQSTGLPLKVSINSNRITDEDDFFLKIDAIGNILKDQGYRQELLIGSNKAFAGRDVFYSGHGNYEIRDYYYALDNGLIPDDYFVFWGYEDEKLFEFARNDLLEMSESGQPFNLTMLTVDTHAQEGYKCRLCRDEFDDQYSNAFACSSRQVAEFVKWIQEQDFYDNTTIVLCGDHPTMSKAFDAVIPEDYTRKTYVCIINPGESVKDAGTGRYREYDTFDMFPTTLAALNVEIPGNRLGLGVNLYSDEKTLIEELGLENAEMQLMRPSAFMESMTNIEITEEMLEKLRNEVVITISENSKRTKVNLTELSYYISNEVVKDVSLELIDKESGESTFIEADIAYPNPKDPNKYVHTVKFLNGDERLNGKHIEDYDVAFYVTVGNIEHYKIADLAHNYKQK